MMHAVRWPLLTALLLTACPPSPLMPPVPDASGGGPDGGAPCLRAFPEEVDFGEIDRFTSAFTRVRITNVSAQTMQVETAPLELPFSLRSLSGGLLDAGASLFVDVQFQAGDSLLHFGRVQASGNEGACTVEVPLRGLGAGSVEVVPTALDFGALEPGESKTLEVNLINSRRVPVVLNGLGITGTDAGVSAFSYAGPSRLELPPVSVTPVRITATPPLRDEFVAFVSTIDVFLRVAGGVPVARVEPSRLDVPVVGFTPLSNPPSFVERVVRVHNDGDAGASALRFESPFFVAVDAVDGGPAPELQIADTTLFFNPIQPGDFGDLVLRFEPRALGTRAFRVTVFTNDPRQPQHSVSFHATVNELPSCAWTVSTVPPRVFGDLMLEARADGGSEAQLLFTNDGTTPCVLDDLRFEPPLPMLQLTGAAQQVRLLPGQTHVAVINGPDAGSGFFVGSNVGFHVLNPSSSREFIPVVIPP